MKVIFNDTFQIIQACKEQNPAAQKYLFDLYHKKIMTICLRYLKDKDTAFEMMNEIFMKLFDKIHLYKTEYNFEGWMTRLAINTIIDYIRTNKHYRQNFIQTNEFHLYGHPDENNDDISLWWDEALNIPSEVIFEMINDLPLATKIVFNLYAIEEFSHKEIAQYLNINEGTSKWHLSNARKILKEKISQIIHQKMNSNETRSKEKY